MKKILLHLVLIPVLCFQLSGCATMFGDNDRHVNVGSSPSGAQVFLNGQEMGTTPTTVEAKGGDFISAKKPGYKSSGAKQVSSEFQGVALLNIFFPIGFVVDAITGNLTKVTTKQVNLPLERGNSEH